jgi:hypothetical protein
MQEQFFDTRVVSMNVIGGCTISTVRVPFYGLDESEGYFETCLFFPNGDCDVLTRSNHESGIVQNHNALVSYLFRHVDRSEVEAHLRELLAAEAA